MEFETIQMRKRVKVYPAIIDRKRASKPKVRTGCKTCKIRRIKCDEAKPCCARCQKSGFTCDGYLEPKNNGAPYSTLLGKPLRPKSIDFRRSPILNFTLPFQDQQEYQYFRYFRDETIKQISVFDEASLWSYIIPQACQDELCLRTLTVSIAALSKASSSPSTAHSHHEFAVNQYGKALKGVQHAVNTRGGLAALRIALISSILIYCFENLHGDHVRAVKHIEATLQLMHSRLTIGKHSYSKVRDLSPIPGLEPELFSIFVRLDNTIICRMDVKEFEDITRESTLRMDYVDEEYNMPTRLNSFPEAKDYLEQFQFSALPQMATLPIDLGNDTPETAEKRARLSGALEVQIQKWYRAFEPLISSTQTPAGSRHATTAAHLRALAIATTVSVRRLSMPKSAEPFVNETMQIVKLCRIVITHPSFLKRFVFDCGIVPPLFVVLISGTRRSIRKEAVELLRLAGPRRELVWDAQDAANIGEALIKAEELQEEGKQCDQPLPNANWPSYCYVQEEDGGISGPVDLRDE